MSGLVRVLVIGRGDKDQFFSSLEVGQEFMILNPKFYLGNRKEYFSDYTLETELEKRHIYYDKGKEYEREMLIKTAKNTGLFVVPCTVYEGIILGRENPDFQEVVYTDIQFEQDSLGWGSW